MQTYKKDFIPYYRDVDRNYTMKLPSVIEYFGIISTFHSAYLGIDPMFMEKRGLGWVLYSWRGSVLLGIIEALVSGLVSSTYRDLVSFTLLILVLVIHPSGLMGKTTVDKA